MMSQEQVLVRYGWQSTIGKFVLPKQEGKLNETLSSEQLVRGTRIVVKTPRGLELGISLGSCQPDESPMGSVIRIALPEDEVLEHHLRQLSQVAHQRCCQWLTDHGDPSVLLEVEPLLDGQTLYFHFLSGVDELVQQHVEELARLYEKEVAASDFAQRVIQGCGPNCGTMQTSGKGCSSCANCRICISKR